MRQPSLCGPFCARQLRCEADDRQGQRHVPQARRLRAQQGGRRACGRLQAESGVSPVENADALVAAAQQANKGASDVWVKTFVSS